jgi:hypothetical protein
MTHSSLRDLLMPHRGSAPLPGLVVGGLGLTNALGQDLGVLAL